MGNPHCRACSQRLSRQDVARNVGLCVRCYDYMLVWAERQEELYMAARYGDDVEFSALIDHWLEKGQPTLA